VSTKGIGRRAGWAISLVLGVMIGLILLPGTAAAPPGAAPVHIVDGTNTDQKAAVDSSGALKVAGQVTVGGTSSVQVTNFPTSQTVNGTVDVGNFPDPVNATFFAKVDQEELSGQEAYPFGQTIRASLIVVNGLDDEVRLIFFPPLPSNPALILYGAGEATGGDSSFTIPLTQPMDLERVIVECNNEVFNCKFGISISGTEVS
jgi:hypothetical protein